MPTLKLISLYLGDYQSFRGEVGKDVGFGDDEAYNVIVPDVTGCVTYGDDFTHAVEMGEEALSLALEGEEVLPVAHELRYFNEEKLKELDIPKNALPQVVTYAQPIKKRITVNLHLQALNAIDGYMKKHGFKNRSAFLEESALMRVGV